VTRDAAATAANILSNETLFRLGVTLALIAVAFHIAWIVLFYDLFKPVSRTLALLTAFVGLIAIALQAVSAIFQTAPLTILHSGESSSAFTAAQLQALAYLSFRLQGQTYNMYLVFFGIWSLLTGYLIFRSGFMPQLVGQMEMLAGVAYLILLWPPLASALHPYYLALGLGELALLFWLLAKGVDSARWHERERALNRALSEN
jgi:general stress protein CsbA